MTPKQLQIKIMDEVTEILKALREERYKDVPIAIANYSIALQKLTDLAEKCQK